MINIKTNDTWVLWPTNVCSSFFDLPANQVISGNKNFTIEMDFKINSISENSGERGTVISFNPDYFVLHYYNEQISAVHMSTNGSKTHNFHRDLRGKISVGETHKLKIVNLEFSDFIVYIDDNKVLETKGFVETKDPQIFLGSETFPNNITDLNSCDMDINEFKIFHNDELICHHDFSKIIHNKFVDLTDNCNFIHKL